MIADTEVRLLTPSPGEPDAQRELPAHVVDL